MTPSEIKSRINAVYPGYLTFEIYGDEVAIVLQNFTKIRVTVQSLTPPAEVENVTEPAESQPGQAQAKKSRRKEKVQL